MKPVPSVVLGDVVQFIRGITFKPDDLVPLDSPGAVACMRTKNVQAELDLSDVWAVPATFVRRRDQFLTEGDLLVSTANSWNLVGKCSWVPALRWPATLGGFISALRADTTRLEPRYLFHWFSSPRVQALARACGRQTTNISNLDVTRCLALEMPLPPLAEQRRIAAILDQAEALRAKRRQTLVRLATVTTSIFLDMFGDPVANPRAWTTASLTDCCEEINDCPHTTPAWTEAGAICLRTTNLTEGGWNWEDTRFVSEATYRDRSARGQIRTGDIILSREGTVGVAAIAEDTRVCMGQRLVQVRPSATSVTSEFMLHHLLYVLAPARIARLLLGSTAQHLNVKDLKALRIPLPPLALQLAFVAQLKSIERVKSVQQASVAKLDALFASLQHRAFRGEL